MKDTYAKTYPFEWCEQCSNQELSTSTLEWYNGDRATLYRCENEGFCWWLVEQARGEE